MFLYDYTILYNVFFQIEEVGQVTISPRSSPCPYTPNLVSYIKPKQIQSGVLTWFLQFLKSNLMLFKTSINIL